jgi:hypothetical protein
LSLFYGTVSDISRTAFDPKDCDTDHEQVLRRPKLTAFELDVYSEEFINVTRISTRERQVYQIYNPIDFLGVARESNPG